MKSLDLIKEVGHAMGQAALDLEKSGGFSLVTQEGEAIHVELSDDQETIYLHAEICSVPQSNKTSVYEYLLGAHTLGLATEEAYFGLDHEGDTIVCFKVLHVVDRDLDYLVEQIDRFTSNLKLWKQDLINGELY